MIKTTADFRICKPTGALICDKTSLCSSGVFGAETNGIQSMSVMEGDSVTLKMNVTELHEEEDITWKFGAERSLIGKITEKRNVSTFDSPDRRFRDRLKLDDKTGSLTITNITTQHAGLYEQQKRGVKLSSKIFSVSVYPHLPVPVIRRDCSSSSSQQNCSLLCSVVNVGHVTLSWYKGNSLLSSISVSDFSISLSLSLEVEYQDKNSYSCVLNNPICNQTTHLDISQFCHTCSALDGHFTSQPVFLIVLVSAAAGSLLIVSAVGIFCICRKHRQTDQEGKSCVFGESVSVMEGDSVTLHTDVTEIHEDDDILWKFGADNSLIAEISREKQIFSTYDDVPDGRFRDRLKLDHQTGSLTITNITSEHAGLYKLEIIGVKWSSKTFSVSVYGEYKSFVLSFTYSCFIV
uniref:Ig-like domain-containing protein n=1 Tax=Sinocyclocheilus anshuiensis TaxID=1608454 RepID=A0A671LYF8_9TELE